MLKQTQLLNQSNPFYSNNFK